MPPEAPKMTRLTGGPRRWACALPAGNMTSGAIPCVGPALHMPPRHRGCRGPPARDDRSTPCRRQSRALDVRCGTDGASPPTSWLMARSAVQRVADETCDWRALAFAFGTLLNQQV